MDFLLDAYVFKYLPFTFNEDTKKSITEKAVNVVRAADWACKAQDPRKLVDNHTSFLVAELLTLVFGVVALIHAYRHKGRYLYTYLSIVVLSLSTELSRLLPGFQVDYVFHAQSTLSLFGMRLPAHLIFGVNVTFVYIAYILAKRLKMPTLLEAFATSLIYTFFYLPYSIIGTKMLWFQWNEWHPISATKNSFDVPVNEYFFQSFPIIIYVIVLNYLRKTFLTCTYDWRYFGRETSIAVFAGSIAFAITPKVFVYTFYRVHETYQIDYLYLVMSYFAVLTVFVISYDRSNTSILAKNNNQFWFDEIAAITIFIGFFFFSIALVGDPIDTVSDGLHQPIGSCKQTDVFMDETYQKYICIYNLDPKTYDFHCLPGANPPQQLEKDRPLEYFAICGTPFANRIQFVFVISSIMFVGGVILYQIAAKSGPTEEDLPLTRQYFPNVEYQSDEEEIEGTPVKNVANGEVDDETPKKAPGTVSREESRSKSRSLPISAKRNNTDYEIRTHTIEEIVSVSPQFGSSSGTNPEQNTSTIGGRVLRNRRTTQQTINK